MQTKAETELFYSIIPSAICTYGSFCFVVAMCFHSDFVHFIETASNNSPSNYTSHSYECMTASLSLLYRGFVRCKCMFCIKSARCGEQFKHAHGAAGRPLSRSGSALALGVSVSPEVRCDIPQLCGRPPHNRRPVCLKCILSPALPVPTEPSERRHRSGCMRTRGRRQSTFRWRG